MPLVGFHAIRDKLVADEIEFYERQYGSRNFAVSGPNGDHQRNREWISIWTFCQEIPGSSGSKLPGSCRHGAPVPNVPSRRGYVAAQLRKTGMINLAYGPRIRLGNHAAFDQEENEDTGTV